VLTVTVMAPRMPRMCIAIPAARVEGLVRV